MQECFTCEGEATERYTMVLDGETVLDDVVMCEACRDSHAEVPWIEILAAPAAGREGNSRPVSEASE